MQTVQSAGVGAGNERRVGWVRGERKHSLLPPQQPAPQEGAPLPAHVAPSRQRDSPFLRPSLHLGRVPGGAPSPERALGTALQRGGTLWMCVWALSQPPYSEVTLA